MGNPKVGLFGVKLTSNALPVDVASGSCPEVGLWDITLLAKSYCGTCPRSRFLANFGFADDLLVAARQFWVLSVIAILRQL